MVDTMTAAVMMIVTKTNVVKDMIDMLIDHMTEMTAITTGDMTAEEMIITTLVMMTDDMMISAMEDKEITRIDMLTGVRMIHGHIGMLAIPTGSRTRRKIAGLTIEEAAERMNIRKTSPQYRKSRTKRVEKRRKDAKTKQYRIFGRRRKKIGRKGKRKKTAEYGNRQNRQSTGILATSGNQLSVSPYIPQKEASEKRRSPASWRSISPL